MNYILVQLALIAIFRMLDLEFLCAAHTVPCHSWQNPVERVISTFKQFCDAAKKTGFQEDAIGSVSHAKVMLTHILECLQVKGKKFYCL